MPFRLAETTIRQRLIEWRNLKRLHAEQKERNQKLEAELRELKVRYEHDLAKRDQLIEKLLLRIGDLEKMVFGEKKNQDGSSSNQSSSGGNRPSKQRRAKDTYRRPTPKDEEVTTTKHHPVTACKHCGGVLSRLEEVTRYVEDIILPQLLNQLTKTVTKHVIERGYCPRCGVWTAAQDARGQLVSLGQNIKLLVTYLVTILDCSFEQVKTLTHDLYGLTLSDGEITNILRVMATDWQPEYEQLKDKIRAGPGAHFDETVWPIQVFAKHCYAWVMSAIGSTARIYRLASSRGKGHAQELLGEAADTYVRITDCYAAYKNLPGSHQICWAHLYRKSRDLLNNDNLPVEKKPAVQTWHDDFKELYAALRSCLVEPFNLPRRQKQENHLRQRVDQLCQPKALDPKPLIDLKNLMIEYDHALFTCLRFANIPCDNNRAEQDIRLVVKKRRKCFGSKTEAGAHTLEILLSVAWSTWYEHRGDYFPALARLTKTAP